MDVVSVYASGIKNVIANSGTAITERQINLIWKFFKKPVICLDGDDSGQRAAIRIAERLIPLINENNKIYFSIMPSGMDPDDFIKKFGKDELFNLLKKKEIIHFFIWNFYLSKIDQRDPYEISKFEKEIKKIAYSIKDETLKKYVLEEFLERIKKLTPIQSSRQNYNFSKFNKKNNFKILRETKILHQKRKGLSKIQIIEFSILFIILEYFDLVSDKTEELSNIEFISEKNNSLKYIILNSLNTGMNKDLLNSKIKMDYAKIISEINIRAI